MENQKRNTPFTYTNTNRNTPFTRYKKDNLCIPQQYTNPFTYYNNYQPPIRPLEEFYVIDFWDIKPNMYIISSYGRIFSLFTMREMRPTISNDGYKMSPLRTIHNTTKHIGVHRLVAKAFILKTEEDILLNRDCVNHKDLNKLNNCVWNLEWMTLEENIVHGYENNAKQKICEQPIRIKTGPSYGDKSGMSRITDEQVHIICQCLEKRFNYKMCCKEAGLEFNDANLSIISNIAAGRRRTNISSQYDIPKNIIKPLNDYTEYIIPVCELLEQGIMIKKIVEELNIPGNYDCARKFVGNIKNKKSYTDISKNYNF